MTLPVTVPFEQLVVGGVYRLRSRNLRCGVYNGKNGFVGIREKFGDRYLFIEYYDSGRPDDHLGTAWPLELLTRTPVGMSLEECEPDVQDANTGRWVEPVTFWPEGGVRTWRFKDDKQLVERCSPQYVTNAALFKLLEELQ